MDLEIVKDVLYCVAALVGIYVGLQGLSTWKKQLRGKTDYNLSKSILVTLFKYRDTIHSLRHPAMFGYEMPEPKDEERSAMSSDEIRFYGLQKAYEKRWSAVQDQRAKLYGDLVEAEALWGNDLKAIFKEIFSLEHELFVSVRNYLTMSNPKENENRKAAVRRLDLKRRDILYDDLSDDGDEFKNDLANQIGKAEDYLKSKLNK